MSFVFGPRYLGGEKIISSVLLKSAVRPLVLSQVSDCSNLEMALCAALMGVAETAKIAPSSTYRERAACDQCELSVSKNDV